MTTFTMKHSFLDRLMQESRRHSPVPGFFCSERLEEYRADDVDNGDSEDAWVAAAPSIIFSCNLPTSINEGKHNQIQIVSFVCRDPSCGALLPSEQAAGVAGEDDTNKLDDNTEEAPPPVDPNFFDAGYTLAGRTGFKVWTGTRIMIETLLWPLPKQQDNRDFSRLAHWQEKIRKGIHILELGAGVGVVGSCLATAGGTVLMTDLPTLVENSVAPNLKRIHRSLLRNNLPDTSSVTASLEQSPAPPSWLGPIDTEDNDGVIVPIGNGWASTMSLDWSKPVEDQFVSPLQIEQVDLLIASDCVFLVEMLRLLLTTAALIFERSIRRHPSLILSFQRRDAKDGDDSESFTTVNRVIREVHARNWSIDCLAWRPVVVNKETTDVFVFEIIPSQ